LHFCLISSSHCLDQSKAEKAGVDVVRSEESWSITQRRAFTRWCNSHLKKRGFPLIEVDLEAAFTDGINLVNIVNALYNTNHNLPPPKLNAKPRNDIFRLENIALALDYLERDAGVQTKFLRRENLLNKELKMVLGMVWCIILDYSIKGISVTDDSGQLRAKDALLLWCRRQTAGYKYVDPPGINGFTKDWANGLGFCALIHKFYPNAIDYSSLSPDNAADNLALAFSTAQEVMGIEPLLDVSDMLNPDEIDSNSVVAYLGEYFHHLAALEKNRKQGGQINAFLATQQSLWEKQLSYEQNARALNDFIRSADGRLNEIDAVEPHSPEEVNSLLNQLRDFATIDKAPWVGFKFDTESQYADLQIQLTSTKRAPYVPPEDVVPAAIEDNWSRLSDREQAIAQKLRNLRFSLISLVERKQGLSPDRQREIDEAFDTFDKDKSGYHDFDEFQAALSALSIVFKDPSELKSEWDAIHSWITIDGKQVPVVTRDAFVRYCTEMLEDNVDNPSKVKRAFRELNGASTFPESSLNDRLSSINGYTPLIQANIPRIASSSHEPVYDFNQYVDNVFGLASRGAAVEPQVLQEYVAPAEHVEVEQVVTVTQVTEVVEEVVEEVAEPVVDYNAADAY